MLISLFVLEPTPLQADAPALIAIFTGTLNPGESRDYLLTIAEDLDRYLFYSKIEGGVTEGDTLDVSILETGDEWWDLQGEVWFWSPALEAGSYTLIFEANSYSTGPLTCTVALYTVPSVPVVFSGRILDVSLNDYCDFIVDFPANATYDFVLGMEGGSYEFWVDGHFFTTVEVPTTTSLSISQGEHYFELDFIADEVTSWSVEIRETTVPYLSLSLLASCPMLNESAGQFSCVLGAQAATSDGGTPEIAYAWSANHGQFNSTASQWVNWTAPVIYEPRSFTVSVVAFAPGYTNATESTVVAVEPIPEFPRSQVIFMILGALLAVCLMRKRHDNDS